MLRYTSRIARRKPRRGLAIFGLGIGIAFFETAISSARRRCPCRPSRAYGRIPGGFARSGVTIALLMCGVGDGDSHQSHWAVWISFVACSNERMASSC